MYVDEDYLKDYTPIGQNVDVNKVLPWVTQVINLRIEPILGAYFLGKITERYLAGASTPNDLVLIERMKPAIAWGAASEAILATSFKLKNKGLQKQFGDYSEAAEMNEINFIYEHYRSVAKNYELLMKRTVCDNAKKYPEASNAENKDGSVYKCCQLNEFDDSGDESFFII